MTKLQDRTLHVLARTVTGRVEERGRWPHWIQRPGKSGCGDLWRTVTRLYSELTNGLALPEMMPPRESRSMDAVLQGMDGSMRLVEVDESQHFNRFRATTLRLYPELAFPVGDWLSRSESARKLPGGGFAKPRPPLFPMPGGRHLQRALRDALADLLPSRHGFAPTLRLAQFELEPWVWQDDAEARMASLIKPRLTTA